jgi:hypothetical protein
MGMQYDVFASAPLTGSGQVEEITGTSALGRTRIKTIYGISGASAGSVSFYNGTSNTAPLLVTLNSPTAANSGTFWLPLPGEGILAQDGVYAELTNVASVTIFYG